MPQMTPGVPPDFAGSLRRHLFDRRSRRQRGWRIRDRVCGIVMALTVLVRCGISHDAARARVDAYLAAVGDSAPELCARLCGSPPDGLSELLGRVEEMIDPMTDAVHLLRGRLVACGQADATPAKPSWDVL